MKQTTLNEDERGDRRRRQKKGKGKKKKKKQAKKLAHTKHVEIT